MKPHKHAEIIHAWADGSEIEYFDTQRNRWITCFNNTPSWEYTVDYRIKPEPKPDVVLSEYFYTSDGYLLGDADKKPNIKLTFDGETGKLKDAEVLK